MYHSFKKKVVVVFEKFHVSGIILGALENQIMAC